MSKFNIYDFKGIAFVFLLFFLENPSVDVYCFYFNKPLWVLSPIWGIRDLAKQASMERMKEKKMGKKI